ncbi:hypothetical protein BDV93DRAFT_479172 [Ceratobasidium sp. AG-I]|nr:hypothetical protein BDV93DRAFT_479172 [Ceratobasidium sp. AG-I]
MILIHRLILFLVAASTLVLASPSPVTWTGDLLARGKVNLGCGSHAPTSAFLDPQLNIPRFSASSCCQPRQIRIYWYVIYNTKTFDGGYLDEDQIHKQVDVLNTHFQGAGISFKLENIDYTQNYDWFFWSTTDNTQMRQTLHRGGYQDLNIYSVRVALQGHIFDLGGFSTWPWDAKSKTNLDGVFFLWLTIPGGPMLDYNQGKVLVHQVGHWCGLYHTFNGGCTEPADFVSDTPLQRSYNQGCPSTPPDSCSNGGQDSIHNFMDYTNDPCKTQFTKGKLTITPGYYDHCSSYVYTLGQGKLMCFSLNMWR